jgi:hypothetical protein
MSIIQFSALALRARIHKDGTETEKRLANLLFDDALQVLSTFDMNQIASLSYGDEPCEQIFDLLGEVMAHPMEFTVLAVQKSLVIAKHLLIYGSEKCVNSCWGLGSYVEKLCEFNTALLAQEQQGLGSWWSSVKGGAVDKGFPVREAAQTLRPILGDAPRIQQLRHDNADPNALVPVGSTEKLGFISDDVRHYLLQKRMKEHELVLTRSNLKKDVGGFGSGFNSANGQAVVGAAHSLEEMMARAEREERKFSETGPVYFKPKPAQPQVEPTPNVGAVLDLLDFNAPAPPQSAPVVDLLDFGGNVSTPNAILDIFSTSSVGGGDLLGGGGAPSGDVFGADLLAIPQPTVLETSNLLSLMTLSVQTTQSQGRNTGLSVVNPTDGLLSMPTAAKVMTDSKSSVMASNSDRFAALDELAPPHEVRPGISMLPAQAAENRSLAFNPAVASIFPPPLNTSAVPPPMYTSDLGITPMGDAMAGIGSGTMITPPPLPTYAPPPPPAYEDKSFDMTPMGGKPVFTGIEGGLMGHGAFLPPPSVPLQAPPPPPPVYGGDHGLPPYPPLGPLPPPPSELPPPPPPDEPSTLVLAAKFGDVSNEESGFYMGGSSGAGL